MNDPLYWVAILSPFFFFALTLSFGLSAQKEAKISYRFSQYFPYELFQGKKNYTLPARICAGLTATSLFFAPVYSLFFLPSTEFLRSNLGFLWFLCALTDGAVALIYALTWIPLSKEKLHLSLFFAESATLSILHSAFFFFYFSKYQRNILDDSTPLLYAAILSAIFFLLSFVPLLNPKLKDYAKLEAHALPDGSVELCRPKIFPLAASEWWEILFGLLGFLTDGILMAWLAITLNQ
ncbi:MAG: hypothetical protein PUC66_00010 [Erysipelotrichaceae bacterium]|nr:hypothetical protein [Erysipelotrichaceae bacterium]